jgi:imidazolonepropionase-like amidohydrolase
MQGVTVTSDKLLILRAATVVDVRAGTLVPRVDVIVEGGRISRIAPTDTVSTDGALVIETMGQYIVPGYVDAHSHPLGQDGQTEALQLMGAFGITGFRQMSGSSTLLSDRASGALDLPEDGPALLAMPGDVLTVMNAGSPDAAAAAVRRQKAEGADFIKVVSVSPPALLAVLDEANAVGISVAGHLPNGIDVREASRRGMRCIEHLGPGVGITAATADDEPAMLADAAAGGRTIKGPPSTLPGMDRMILKMMKDLIINPVAANTLIDIDLLERAEETFDEAKAREVAQVFVRNETWQCPTLIRVRTQQLADDPVHTGDPELRYISESTLRSWRESNEKFAKQGDPAHQTYRRNYALQLRLTKIFADAGVPLLIGSDACGAGWVIPGHSLHQEFDEMTAAGLDPLTVLRAATMNASTFFGTSESSGTVEEGKNADLVVLRDNPLERASALHDIAGVVRAGRYRSAEQLNAVKDRIAAARSIH